MPQIAGCPHTDERGIVCYRHPITDKTDHRVFGEMLEHCDYGLWLPFAKDNMHNNRGKPHVVRAYSPAQSIGGSKLLARFEAQVLFVPRQKLNIRMRPDLRAHDWNGLYKVGSDEGAVAIADDGALEIEVWWKDRDFDPGFLVYDNELPPP